MKKFFFGSSIFLILLIALFLNLGKWLDVTHAPVKSDIIVCLGGGDWHRIDKAIALYQKGYAAKSLLLLTGDDVTPKRKREGYEDFRVRLLKQKYPKIQYLHFPNVGSTRAEASFLTRYMKDKQYKSALVVTDPPHSGRFEILAFLASFGMKKKPIFHMTGSGVPWWNKTDYWHNTFARKYTVMQFLKIPYNVLQMCCEEKNTNAQ